MEKIEVFITILFIFLALNFIMNFAFSYNVSGSTPSCNVFNISACFSNLGKTYSVSYLFGSANITPFMDFFLFLADTFTLIGSFFILNIGFPFLPSYILAFFDAINGVMVSLMVLTLLPFIFGG